MGHHQRAADRLEAVLVGPGGEFGAVRVEVEADAAVRVGGQVDDELPGCLGVGRDERADDGRGRGVPPGRRIAGAGREDAIRSAKPGAE